MQRSLLRHLGQRRQAEVEQSLAQQVAVAFGGQRLLRQLGLHLGLLLAGRRHQQRRQLAHQLAEVERLQLVAARRDEAEEGLEPAVQARELLLEHVDVAQQLVAVGGIGGAPRGDHLLQDLEVEDHGVDRRPQVVGHRRRDLRHRPHLRGQAEVRLQPAQGPGVLDEEDAAVGGVAAQIEEQPPRRQVESGEVGRAAGAVPAEARAFEAGFELLPQALQLAAVRAAEKLQGPPIGETQPAGGVQADDARAEELGELVARGAGGRRSQRILSEGHGSFFLQSRGGGTHETLLVQAREAWAAGCVPRREARARLMQEGRAVPGDVLSRGRSRFRRRVQTGNSCNGAPMPTAIEENEKLESGLAIAVFVDPVESAKAAGLRYVTDDESGIRRRKRGRGFTYLDPQGRTVEDPRQRERIHKLAIPPAWTDVWICARPNGHLQATGRDARGRKQYRYHADWRQVRDETKFGRMAAFGEALPKIRQRTERDLALSGLPREKVLATVVRLLETTLIRVGNKEYARQNNSFGLTTLRDRHVDVSGSKLRFEFRGKSGKDLSVEIQDRRLARIVKQCRDLPGQK